MRLIAFAVMLFSSMLLFGENGSTVHADEIKKENNKKSKTVQVEPGDSLIKIAKKHKTTYPRVFYANKQIKDPDVIYPGDKLRIPKKDEKLAKRPLSAVAEARISRAESLPSKPSYAPQANHSVPTPPPSYSGGNSAWDRLAQCESGGNWAINTGNGYYGGLQFNLGTWQSNGGHGYPHQASKSEQIRVAKNLHAARGFSPWPACSAKLGLR